MAKKPAPRTRQPGEDTEHDTDKALEAGQSGGTHKVTKPKPEVGLSKVKGDPTRPADAAVNAKKEMPYVEAMKLHAKAIELNRLFEQGRPRDAAGGEAWDKEVAALRPLAQTKSILTEQGWVAVPNRKAPPQAS